MTADIKEEETKLSYDDRRKILNQKKSQTTVRKTEAVKEGDKIIEEPKLISTAKENLEVEYTEKGIKLAHKNLVEEKKFLEERSIKLKEQFEEVGEMPEDLKEFKDKISQLGKYDASEKAKSEYEALQERLKQTNKELKQLTDAIGDRLKL